MATKYLLTALLTLLVLSPLFADTTKTEIHPSESLTTNGTLPATNSSITESEAYKLLYENSKESNDRMLSAIQWVIGISIAFLLAILGSQIFFNWRINKKEIDLIKKDIDEKIGELKAELIKEVSAAIKEKSNSLSVSGDKLESELKEQINKQFEEQRKVAELSEKLREKEIEFIKKEIANDIKKLKIDIEKNSGDLWLLKGIESNALSSFTRTAILQLELKHDIKYILDDIVKVLEKLNEIHNYDYENLDNLLEKIGESYPHKKKRIEELYKQKPTYKYVENRAQGLFNSLGIDSYLSGSNKEYVRNKPKE